MLIFPPEQTPAAYRGLTSDSHGHRLHCNAGGLLVLRPVCLVSVWAVVCAKDSHPEKHNISSPAAFERTTFRPNYSLFHCLIDRLALSVASRRVLRFVYLHLLVKFVSC